MHLTKNNIKLIVSFLSSFSLGQEAKKGRKIDRVNICLSSYLSLTCLLERYLRRCLMAADSEITVHCPLLGSITSRPPHQLQTGDASPSRLRPICHVFFLIKRFKPSFRPFPGYIVPILFSSATLFPVG